jgi:hypothetical protein
MPEFEVVQIKAGTDESAEVLYEAARMTFRNRDDKPPTLPTLDALRLYEKSTYKEPGMHSLDVHGLTLTIKTASRRREIELIWAGTRKEKLRSVTVTFVGKNKEHPKEGVKTSSIFVAGQILGLVLLHSAHIDMRVTYRDKSGQQYHCAPEKYPGPTHPQFKRAAHDDAWRAQNWDLFVATFNK